MKTQVKEVIKEILYFSGTGITSLAKATFASGSQLWWSGARGTPSIWGYGITESLHATIIMHLDIWVVEYGEADRERKRQRERERVTEREREREREREIEREKSVIIGIVQCSQNRLLIKVRH